jgi:Tol biopolymer transport system component
MHIGLTGVAKVVRLAASPDGQLLAYIATDSDRPGARGAIWMKDLRSGSLTQLDIDRSVSWSWLTFSPDGQSLLFHSQDDRTLRRVSIGGGQSTRVSSVGNLAAVDWGDNDVVVFAQYIASGIVEIRKVAASGGESELVTTLEPRQAVSDIHILPGSRAMLLSSPGNVFDSRPSQIAVMPFDGGPRQTIIGDGLVARFDRNSRQIVYRSAAGAFWRWNVAQPIVAVPFDESSMRVTGEPAPFAEDIGPVFAVSASGVLAHVTEPLELVRVARDGTPTLLGELPERSEMPRVSPDGTRLAFVNNGIRIAPLNDLTRSARRLTSDPSDRAPVWSPDGATVAFTRGISGNAVYDAPPDRPAEQVQGVYAVPIDGRQPPVLMARHGGDPQFWSRGSGRLGFERWLGGDASLWTITPGESASRLVMHGNAALHSALSADGRWLAFEWPRSIEFTPRRDVYISPFTSGGRPQRLTETEVHHPVWLSATELVTEDDKELLVTPVRPTSPGRVTIGEAVPWPKLRSERPLFGGIDRQWDVMPSDEAVVVMRRGQPRLVVVPKAPSGVIR